LEIHRGLCTYRILLGFIAALVSRIYPKHATRNIYIFPVNLTVN
jgi:hypothetical protein